MATMFSEIKCDPKVEYERKKDRNRERAIRADIAKINSALENGSEQELITLHRYLDNKYQICIAGWEQSMYGYFDKHGFNYEILDVGSIRDNLESMSAKLEGYILKWNEVGHQRRLASPTYTPDLSVTVNNTNTVNITLSFEDARQKVEDMTALSREQTDEILDKINELESISEEKSSRKTKWEKVKPIISFALDKGTDVAIAILSLVMQMKLGS